MDDTHIFTTADQYREWLDKRDQAAHRGLHEHQADLTYGSHWVRFTDLTSGLIEFGRILSMEEIADMAGGSSSQRYSVQSSTDRLSVEHDMVLSLRRDKFNIEGDLGYAHRSHLWPIEDRLYYMAMDAEFDYARLGEVGQFLLQVALRGMRAHLRSRA